MLTAKAALVKVYRSLLIGLGDWFYFGNCLYVLEGGVLYLVLQFFSCFIYIFVDGWQDRSSAFWMCNGRLLLEGMYGTVEVLFLTQREM